MYVFFYKVKSFLENSPFFGQKLTEYTKRLTTTPARPGNTAKPSRQKHLFAKTRIFDDFWRKSYTFFAKSQLFRHFW